MNIGTSSSLPASISNERSSLPSPEKPAKLPEGPTASRPGPILLTHESTAVKDVTRSLPSKQSSKVETAIRNISAAK